MRIKENVHLFNKYLLSAYDFCLYRTSQFIEHNAAHRTGTEHFMKPFLYQQNGNYIKNVTMVSLACNGTMTMQS